MKSGKRGWWVFVLPLLAGLLAIAFWPATSSITWTYRTSFDMLSQLSPPVVGRDGTIYIGNRRGELIAIDPGGREKWVVKLGLGMVRELVIAPDGNIYVPWAGVGRESGLASVTPAGNTNWFFKEPGGTVATPAVAPDGTIYFSGHSSNVHALNPDGSIRWKFATQGIIETPPALTPEGNIGVVSHDQHFYLFDRDGSVLVRREFASRFPPRGLGYSPEGFWVLGINSIVHALNPDGSHRWTTDLLTFAVPRTNLTFAPFIQGSPQFSPGGEILLSTGNGYIYRLNDSGKILSAFDKGLRVRPGSGADLQLTQDHRWLLAYEEGLSVPTSPTSFIFGTERAALVQLAPDGREEWRALRSNDVSGFSELQGEPEAGLRSQKPSRTQPARQRSGWHSLHSLKQRASCHSPAGLTVKRFKIARQTPG